MAKSGFTTYQQQRILNRLFGAVAYTEPATLYLGVSSTTINENGTGATEPTGGAYSRISVSNNTSTWGNLSVGVGRQNLVPFEWASATAPWGTITYVGVYDALTGGNMLYYSELVVPKNIGADDVLRVAVNSIQIRLQPTA
jgi:hypothetical protein